MTTNTTQPVAASVSERIAVATAATVIGALIGTIIFPGGGTALGAKIGAMIGGGSAS